MTNVRNQPSPPEAPATPPADFKPEIPEQQLQPSARELELQATIDRLNSENADLKAVPADKQALAVYEAKKGFKVPKGEEGYTHVVETKVNGEDVEPRHRAYDPHQYDTLISKQKGYDAEVLHIGK